MGKMEAAEQTGLAQPSPSSRAQTVTLRELSTDLQQGWIERLFSRFAALYGAAFGRQWEGTNLAEVKSIWAEKLGGFNAQQIGEALKTCDERPYPPNLPEFIELCRASARRSGNLRLALVEPQDASPKDRRERIEQLTSSVRKTEEYDYRGWCKELKRRYLAGVKLYPMQISMASEAMGEVWQNGECHPIERKA